MQGSKLADGHQFLDMTVDGVHCGPDGMRADVSGNLWCSSNAPLGDAGLLVYNAQGKLSGRIRLPEVCFGGPKRNHLMMAASQSERCAWVKLYKARVAIEIVTLCKGSGATT